jgi:hypothetical protein
MFSTLSLATKNVHGHSAGVRYCRETNHEGVEAHRRLCADAPAGHRGGPPLPALRHPALRRALGARSRNGASARRGVGRAFRGGLASARCYTPVTGLNSQIAI